MIINEKFIFSGEPEQIRIKVTPSPFEDFQEMPNPTSTVDTLSIADVANQIIPKKGKTTCLESAG